MTRDELKEAIQGISDILKKPGISFLERQLLNADRKEFRSMLEQMNREVAPQ